MHCVVCGFIKLYKHDFEVMKYINYVEYLQCFVNYTYILIAPYFKAVIYIPLMSDTHALLGTLKHDFVHLKKCEE